MGEPAGRVIAMNVAGLTPVADHLDGKSAGGPALKIRRIGKYLQEPGRDREEAAERRPSMSRNTASEVMVQARFARDDVLSAKLRGEHDRDLASLRLELPVVPVSKPLR